MTTKELTFFITHHKENNEFILQEGNLLLLKIPKPWQKTGSGYQKSGFMSLSFAE